MPLNQITLISTLSSRFYFHFDLELFSDKKDAFLELSLDSVLDPEKRNVIRYEFKEAGLQNIVDKIPLSGLESGPYVFALCLKDSLSNKVLDANSFPVEIVLEVDPMMDFLFDFEILSLAASDKKGLECKALIKNLGRSGWGDDSPLVDLSFLFIPRNAESSSLPIRIDLPNSLALGSGQVAEVTLTSSRRPNIGGVYEFILQPLINKEEVPFSSLNTESCCLYFSGAQSDHRAQINVSSYQIKLGKYLLMEGRVKNIGSLDWYFGAEVMNPTLLGFMLRRSSEEGEKVFAEFRFKPDDLWCKSGESFDFSATFESKEVIEGPFVVSIDMLIERAYWFREFESVVVDQVFDDKLNVPAPSLNQIKEKSSYFDKIIDNEIVESVYVVAPSLPLFDRESGGLRMFEFLRLLKSESRRVVYFYESNGIAGDVSLYLKALSDLGVEVVADIKAAILEKEFSPELVLVNTWACIERYLPDLKKAFPSALFLGDMVDLHWVRERRAIDSGLSDLSLIEWESRQEREKAAYNSCDMVIAVTDEDRVSLLAECPSARTVIVSNIHTLRNMDNNSPAKESPRALFVGHFRHTPNVSACLKAVQIIQAYNESHDLKISIDIIGDNAPLEIQRLDNGLDVCVHGYVPDLSTFEKEASFFLAPIQFGAGIKGKVCEAIASGLPLILSDIANEGINLVHREEAYVANHLGEYVSGIEYVLENPKRKNAMVNASRDKLDRLVSKSAITPIVNNLISVARVTIAVVTYNNAMLLEKCLNSIFELTNYPSFKVFVYSNACSDGTKAVLDRFKANFGDKFEYFIGDENEFFVRPNNFIINECIPDDVVLLNNDVEILDPYWLCELNYSSYMAPWVGASGCLVLGEDGKILEAGAKMSLDGMGANLGRGDSPENPAYNRLQYVDYVSGCCLYMKRSSIDLIGALDDDFHPMYYEDAAWQFSLKLKGLKTVYTPRTRILHKEGSSAGRDVNSGMKKYQILNREKFKAKFSKFNVNFKCD